MFAALKKIKEGEEAGHKGLLKLGDSGAGGVTQINNTDTDLQWVMPACTNLNKDIPAGATVQLNDPDSCQQPYAQVKFSGFTYDWIGDAPASSLVAPPSTGPSGSSPLPSTDPNARPLSVSFNCANDCTTASDYQFTYTSPSSTSGKHKKSSSAMLIVVIVCVVVILLVFLVFVAFFMYRRKTGSGTRRGQPQGGYGNGNGNGNENMYGYGYGYGYGQAPQFNPNPNMNTAAEFPALPPSYNYGQYAPY